MDSMQQSTQQFMVMKHGQQLGPYPKEMLLENVKIGNFTFDDLIWQPQMQGWEALRYHVSKEELSRVGISVAQMQRLSAGSQNTPHGKAATAFAETFGFHPAAATLIVLVDLIIFGGTLASVGLAWFVLVFVAFFLGLITYLIQTSWYGDENKDALAKGLIALVLTAIPLPIATALMIYFGISGRLRSQKQVSA